MLEKLLGNEKECDNLLNTKEVDGVSVVKFKNGAVMGDKLVGLLTNNKLCVSLFVVEGFVTFKPKIEISSGCTLEILVLDVVSGDMSRYKYVYEEVPYDSLFN
jgi:hypothetical protein